MLFTAAVLPSDIFSETGNIVNNAAWALIYISSFCIYLPPTILGPFTWFLDFAFTKAYLKMLDILTLYIGSVKTGIVSILLIVAAATDETFDIDG